jgi:hypothetical protein
MTIFRLLWLIMTSKYWLSTTFIYKSSLYRIITSGSVVLGLQQSVVMTEAEYSLQTEDLRMEKRKPIVSPSLHLNRGGW